MLSKECVFLSLALAVIASPVAWAQSSRDGGTVYERPAPIPSAPAPAALPIAAAASIARKPGPHERAVASRQRKQPEVAARDVPLASPPRAQAEQPPGSGPVEPAAPVIRDLVAKHARENGVPENLAAAVVRIESRFNPRARGGGALGLMQIKYDTARAMGYAGGVTSLLSPETNLHFGMKVLADAYRSSHGDICLTLARYQSGHLVTHASATNRAYCARARMLMARAS